MTAVTTLERVQELRHRLELMLTLDNWGSSGALDRLLADVSKLPHSAERNALADDLLELRLTVAASAQREQECPAQ